MSVIDVTRLSAQQKLDLIAELCDSLDAADIPLSPAWKAELERRNADFEEMRDQTEPWEQVRAALQADRI
ncbi:addiction module protein [Niveispirillum sp.]|uniref:addiction module protein n=1 Tax=Niveispirillum sp. TaxID=1917217 RepID=UPI001B56B307|nr:addiction module protein [Niveispirillum sp.]MBP7338152.1 addiction module protein [Niveispirillum sp.]